MSAAIALVGIDLGKTAFHLHVQDPEDLEVLRKKPSRAQLLHKIRT